ncbi:MAG TPA: serine protease [Bacteroidales bacterium]|nr:serine protease [Bacteroidales bacterium]
MYSQVWEKCSASVCCLNFYNEHGVLVDTLSGFKINKSLVTCEQAFYIKGAQKVEIRFVEADANTTKASMRIDYKEFLDDLRIGFIHNQADYAVFNIDFAEFQDIPSLSICERWNYPIGMPVAVLGFNGVVQNLSIKTGIVSSAFSNKLGVRYLQIDALTCYGNSGAPVIDPQTMQVVAIVSRRNTPATKSYNDLMGYIRTNLEELRKIEGKFKLGELDPVQVLIANQNQIKLLASNIYKHSASGVSEAVMLDHIITYFNEQAIIENHSLKSTEVEFDVKVIKK